MIEDALCEDPPMRLMMLTVALLLTATTALAQSRPSTLGMSCRTAAGLVASRGAIRLSTGPHTFDRYVRDRSFCELDENIEPRWEPTADMRQCFIGYRCSKDYDDNKFD